MDNEPSFQSFLFKFQANVKERPKDIAIVRGERRICYEELNVRSEAVAAELLRQGMRPKDIVGLIVDRSEQMIIFIVGILKAGGAFLPLDVKLPVNRINFILEETNCPLLLTNLKLPDNLAYTGKVLHLGEEPRFTGECRLPRNFPGHQDMAYILYTSGSTGQPKGVMVSHGSLTHFIEGIVRVIPLEQRKSILALTTISFDIFIMETLIPLTRGMRVVIACESRQSNPALLKTLIREEQVQMIQMTPSRMYLLLLIDPNLDSLSSVTEIMLGGELFPSAMLKELQRCTDAKIYNMYGPTETTIWASVRDVTDCEEADLGTPLANMRLDLVNEHRELISGEGEGEIIISGPGVALGYLNRPELTARKFGRHPLGFRERCYATGDLARRSADGRLFFLGRKDNQVKIRGNRVEPGEVEKVLSEYAFIKQCAVVARYTAEPIYLCAFYTADRRLDAKELRNYLGDFLPDYMLPEEFVQLEELPRMINDKIDRSALKLVMK